MTEVTIVATVEYKDGTVRYRTFRATGVSIARMQRSLLRRLKAEEHVTHVELGKALVQHSYGAH